MLNVILLCLSNILVNVRLHKTRGSLSAMAMKEGGHVSELLLFLDIIFVCFLAKKEMAGKRERKEKAS